MPRDDRGSQHDPGGTEIRNPRRPESEQDGGQRGMEADAWPESEKGIVVPPSLPPSLPCWKPTLISATREASPRKALPIASSPTMAVTARNAFQQKTVRSVSFMPVVDRASAADPKKINDKLHFPAHSPSDWFID